VACNDYSATSGGSPLRGSGLIDRVDVRCARSISASPTSRRFGRPPAV